jgi:hypothetical protein
VAWYGPTGNLAFRDVDGRNVRRTLPRITGTEWAVVFAEDLDRAVALLGGLAAAAHALDERPTAGLAFEVTGSTPGAVTSTERACGAQHGGDLEAGPRSRSQAGPPSPQGRLGSCLRGHRSPGGRNVDVAESMDDRRTPGPRLDQLAR